MQNGSRASSPAYACDSIVDALTSLLAGARRRPAALILGWLLLVLPASAILPMTRWNLHVWQRLHTARRESPDIGLDRVHRALAFHLPARGVVGFQHVGDPDQRRLFFRLQYSLAPRKIVTSTDQEFVIEAGPPAASGSLSRNPRFVLVVALDDELRLFRRLMP